MTMTYNGTFDTFDALKTAVAEWMNRNDMAGSLPAMVALAETRMRRELEPLFPETSTTLTVTGGVAALPSDCGMVVTVRYDNRRTLPQIGLGSVLDHSGYSEPQCFSLEQGGLRVWPAVDCTLTLIYRTTFQPLSDAAPTNWILQDFPDAYLFGSMFFAEGWIANDSRAAVMAQMFEGALASVKAYLTQKSLSGPLVPRLTCP